MKSAAESIVLRRGVVTLPQIGLGCWQAKYSEAKRCVGYALDNGYRLIDGGRLYYSERGIGQALKGRPRDSFVYVSKLSPEEHGQVEEGLTDTLSRLGLDYVDLFLINQPNGRNIIHVWKEMLRLRDAGLTRAVGVSNFGWRQLEGLKATGMEMPEVNQIQLNVFNHQKEDVEYLKKEQIAIMAYAPLAHGQKFGELGGATHEEEAAWMIRWCIDKGYVVVPKSSNEERIRQNLDAASATDRALSAEKMAELDRRDEKYSIWKKIGIDGAQQTKLWEAIKDGPVRMKFRPPGSMRRLVAERREARVIKAEEQTSDTASDAPTKKEPKWRKST